MDALTRGWRPRRRPILASVAILLALSGPAAAGCFDLELYGRVLGSYTAEVEDTAGVRVDYRGLRGQPEWSRLLESLAACAPDTLARRQERLAFWVNAYNILAIDLVLRHYPVESIRDIGSLFRSVWRREAGRIDGRPYSLETIEHDILRPLGDPRIHGAIVCASVSCPPLRREPFRAARLDSQLDEALTSWLAEPRKGARLDPDSGTLHLSRVFDWFEEDFEPHGGVLRFLRPYLPAGIGEFLEEWKGSVRVRYLHYDWRLNDLATRGS